LDQDMLTLAEKNKAKSGEDNVEFVRAHISKVSLPDGIANAIISNCVINLVPASEKYLVFEEMFRLLKPGGRVAISDILARKPLPEALQKSVAAYCGCISGASLVEEYHAYLMGAGFGGECFGRGSTQQGRADYEHRGPHPGYRGRPERVLGCFDRGKQRQQTKCERQR
jgi:arsenite methyltransferase